MKNPKLRKGSIQRVQNLGKVQIDDLRMPQNWGTSQGSTQQDISSSIVNALHPSVNPYLYTSNEDSRKIIKKVYKSEKQRFKYQVPQVHKSTLEDADPWARWYVEKYGQPMGDAYEPDIMQALEDFGLTEERIIATEDVIRAGQIMRNRGDKSFLAMMTALTASDYVWTEHPITNVWRSRAKFPGE